jgi:FkbM family methyltransferase
MSYIVKAFRQLHHVARHWKYRRNPDVAIKYDIKDFIDSAKEFKISAGFQPILITDDGIFIRTKEGFFVWFDPSQEHGILWGVEKSGVWEPGIMKICVDRLQDSGTFLDIGANVGMFSMSIATNFENVNIHAFEPVPSNFNVLKQNLIVNSLEHRITANNLAVGSICSTINMCVEGQTSHVSHTKSTNSLKKVGINLLSIDHYCETHNINDVKLIKCDVEGFELEVLTGAEKVLHSQKPCLVVEIEDRWTDRYGYSGKDVFVFLEQLGYVARAILYNGELGDKNASISEKLEHSNVFLFEHEH